MMNVQENVLRIAANYAGLTVKQMQDKGLRTRKELGFDSLDDIEFIMSIEEQFDLEIPDAHAEKFNELMDVINYVTVEIK